jgi:hypothetical protein
MAAPAVLGSAGAVRTNDHVVGPLVLSAAIIAVSEVTRPVRWVNVALGLWLILAPWVLGAEQKALANSTVVGLLLIGFALVRGRVRHSVGGGWAALWQANAVKQN